MMHAGVPCRDRIRQCSVAYWLAAGLALLVPLSPIAAEPPLSLPPTMTHVREVLTAPSRQNPAVAVLPGGIVATRADMLRWIEGAGGSGDEFDRADTEERIEMLCAFVDDLELGSEQLALGAAASSRIDGPALWRATLARAAYRDLVDGRRAESGPALPADRIDAIQAAMAAVGPPPAGSVPSRFGTDPRLDPALLRHAITSGIAGRPKVQDVYRRALFHALVQARHADIMGKLATRYRLNPAADMDADDDQRVTISRSVCLPTNVAHPTFAAARRVNAQIPFLHRSVALAVRRRSQRVLVASAVVAEKWERSGGER